MPEPRKRATIYFDPEIHQALRLKAAETDCSISELVETAVRNELGEDEEDLRAFEKRSKEKSVSFEQVVKDLKARGKI